LLGGNEMSWEYDENTKPCDCGKGLIKIVSGSNDWGQTYYQETILCPECKEKDEKIKALRQERLRIANTKITLVMSYFRDNYKDLLESKFVNLGRKKAIWKTASDLGIED
jgi:hypothetical protein